MDERYTHWHHAPAHRFRPNGAYFITCGTFHKKWLFNTPEKRDFLLHSIIWELSHWSWTLDAWAVLSNHYHFVAHAPEDAETLSPMMKALHSKTAIWLNRIDQTPGRKVWYQFHDTCLTFHRSYLCRLHYVHHNPVKHGLVGNAEDYPWCSMAWFVQNADPSFVRTVLSFPIDRLNIDDDF